MNGLFRRYPDTRPAIVNLKSGTSFKGVIWGYRRPYLVMRGVEMLSDRDRKVQESVDGEVLVILDDVDFIQVVG
jgi:hypothetical protein